MREGAKIRGQQELLPYLECRIFYKGNKFMIIIELKINFKNMSSYIVVSERLEGLWKGQSKKPFAHSCCLFLMFAGFCPVVGSISVYMLQIPSLTLWLAFFFFFNRLLVYHWFVDGENINWKDWLSGQRYIFFFKFGVYKKFRVR